MEVLVQHQEQIQHLLADQVEVEDLMVIQVQQETHLLQVQHKDLQAEMVDQDLQDMQQEVVEELLQLVLMGDLVQQEQEVQEQQLQ